MLGDWRWSTGGEQLLFASVGLGFSLVCLCSLIKLSISTHEFSSFRPSDSLPHPAGREGASEQLVWCLAACQG